MQTESELASEERERQQEIKARRERIIQDDLLNYANIRQGQKQELFYARNGQYGKDNEVLTILEPAGSRNGPKYGWYDPTQYRAHGLAIFTNKADALTFTMDKNEERAFVIFMKTFQPQWQTEQKEVALIYNKHLK